MKKVFFSLFLLIIVAAVGLFLYKLFLGEQEKGALQVTSTPGSKVFLNGEQIGNTPLCRCPQSDGENEKGVGEMLPVGEYTVRLVPLDGKLPEFQEKIKIEKSVLTVIDRKFGDGATSDAVVIALTSLQNDKENELVIVSLPDAADVLLDGSLKGKTPLSLKNVTPSDHTLTVQKQGYKSKTIRIRATNGYKLTARGYLGIDPLFVAGQQVSASASATPTPSLGVSTVTILETGTGFLRVRDEDSLAGTEVGRVTPGEKLSLLDEKTGWYQIQMTDGSAGWISSQFAEKNE